MTNESKIEQKLIEKLIDLKYTYRGDIRDKRSLEQNFRVLFEELNKVHLTDTEFERLKEEIITSDVFAASKKLRERNTFRREDDTPLHYTLVNTKDWCKNKFEVINQLRMNTEHSFHRYDVILLINGVPVVQIELKTLHIAPRPAMEQIVKYKNDPGNSYANSLLCFMQLFIVSNESTTFYFSNNRKDLFCFNADERFLPIYQFADENNKNISNLYDFTHSFLPKCTLGRMISRYMVLVETEQKLMIMRPYQIYAVKAIIDCIEQNRGNGYIWHTTGSGKTLTSFKASTLLKDNPSIEKCLFVVDRKDLDKQTRDEFNKFQKKCVEENTNTETLVQRLLSEDKKDKVIVTTIQKLGIALDEQSTQNETHKKNGKLSYKTRLEPLRNKRIVIIFDECHRSQFGENHRAIKEFFPKSQLFGFTGTPIFEENATQKQIDGTTKILKTTEDVFETRLHTYTITHAIEDKNVLGFLVDYFMPAKKLPEKMAERMPEKLPDTTANSNISTQAESEKNTKSIPQQFTKKAIVESILHMHEAKTDSRKFNAIFATASINDAIEYYELFREVQKEKQTGTQHGTQSGKQLDENYYKENQYYPLNLACVFSPPTQTLSEDSDKNKKDVQQLQEDLLQEKEDNTQEPEKKYLALNNIIEDYNTQYGTNHRIGEFDLYYQDVQQRIKDQQYSNKDYPHKNKIDIIIVVDMLLTGFDSKYLNTLYVDKNLKHHGLIQAFSRTNRILNDTKPFGNVLDFRQQQEAVDRAIELFSGKNKEEARQIWLVESAPEMIEKFEEAVQELQDFMKSQGLDCAPEEVNNLKGDHARGSFINKYKEIQRICKRLSQHSNISDEDNARIEAIMPEDSLRAFRGVYLDIAQRLKATQDKNDTLPDTDDDKQPDQQPDQIDFEFVLFSSALIDYDYIMSLVSSFTQAETAHHITREQIISMLKSSANLMEEQEDIINYVNTLEVGRALSDQEVHEGLQSYISDKAAEKLNTLAHTHGLDANALHGFVKHIMDRMFFNGETLSDLIAPLDLGWKENSQKEEALMKDLIPLLKKRANGQEIMGLNVYEQ